jgi:hypothetical protein
MMEEKPLEEKPQEEKPQKTRGRENLSEQSSEEQNHGFAIHSPGKMEDDPFLINKETKETKANLPPKANSV